MIKAFQLQEVNMPPHSIPEYTIREFCGDSPTLSDLSKLAKNITKRV
jgi:hypothetical protein